MKLKSTQRFVWFLYYNICTYIKKTRQIFINFKQILKNTSKLSDTWLGQRTNTPSVNLPNPHNPKNKPLFQFILTSQTKTLSSDRFEIFSLFSTALNQQTIWSTFRPDSKPSSLWRRTRPELFMKKITRNVFWC